MIVEALTAACIGLSASGVIGNFFYRDRPFVIHIVFQLIKHPANASFPSDHAIGAFGIATTILAVSKEGRENMACTRGLHRILEGLDRGFIIRPMF